MPTGIAERENCFVKGIKSEIFQAQAVWSLKQCSTSQSSNFPLKIQKVQHHPLVRAGHKSKLGRGIVKRHSSNFSVRSQRDPSLSFPPLNREQIWRTHGSKMAESQVERTMDSPKIGQLTK